MDRAPKKSTHKRLIRTSEHPYHVTARSNNGEFFPIPMDELWNIFSQYLRLVSYKHSVRIHAFVLMDNHFHMLVSTPKENIDKAMQFFMREIAKEVNGKKERINHLFGERYHWTLICSANQYAHVLKYIYLNPVRANICQKAQDYPYSTIINSPKRNLLPFSPVPNSDASMRELIPGHKTDFLHWINEKYGDEEIRAIRKALKKSYFKYPSRLKKSVKKQLEMSRWPSA